MQNKIPDDAPCVKSASQTSRTDYTPVVASAAAFLAGTRAGLDPSESYDFATALCEMHADLEKERERADRAEALIAAWRPVVRATVALGNGTNISDVVEAVKALPPEARPR